MISKNYFFHHETNSINLGAYTLKHWTNLPILCQILPPNLTNRVQRCNNIQNSKTNSLQITVRIEVEGTIFAMGYGSVKEGRKEGGGG